MKVKEHEAVPQVKDEVQRSVKQGKVYTLADAIREGGRFCEQAYAWEDHGKVCALGAALVSLSAREVI